MSLSNPLKPNTDRKTMDPDPNARHQAQQIHFFFSAEGRGGSCEQSQGEQIASAVVH